MFPLCLCVFFVFLFSGISQGIKIFNQNQIEQNISQNHDLTKVFPKFACLFLTIMYWSKEIKWETQNKPLSKEQKSNKNWALKPNMDSWCNILYLETWIWIDPKANQIKLNTKRAIVKDPDRFVVSIKVMVVCNIKLWWQNISLPLH